MNEYTYEQAAQYAKALECHPAAAAVDLRRLTDAGIRVTFPKPRYVARFDNNEKSWDVWDSEHEVRPYALASFWNDGPWDACKMACDLAGRLNREDKA